MKELSVEEKAKAYDVAIERANAAYKDEDRHLKATLERIFPELKESDDERIRKYIISSLNVLLYTKGSQADKERNDAIDWLEKQAFNVDNANKEYWRGYREGKQEIIDKYAELEKQGKQRLVEKYNIKGIGSKNAQGKLGEMIKEMKSADKIEPKFKVGDWITDGNITIQIKAIENDCYLYCGDCVLYSTKTADKVYHIWTIEDAKDGDILAVEPINDYPSPFITIYKERGLDYFNSYCFIGFDAKFYTGDTGHNITDIHPATKEQCAQLEKAMTDAGYTFDFEKKELKKIGDKNPLLSDFFKAEYERGKADAQKSTWSEEDERIYQSIMDDTVQENQLDGKQIDWLRDIKYRHFSQSQQEWSEEDEKMMQYVIGSIDTNISDSNFKNIKIWFESVKERFIWKPTEEQMKALHDLNLTGAISYAGQGQELINLYNELKKL